MKNELSMRGRKGVTKTSMIKKLTTEYIDDIAIAHRLAWQQGFRGILSNSLLDALCHEDFVANWNNIISRAERTNLIKVVASGKAVGFVSFGPPYDKDESCLSEIYGIYVHPDYWNQGIGYELMTEAIHQLKKKFHDNGVILWTMSKNKRSHRFYEKAGFQQTHEQRISRRNGESFEEIKYQYDAN